MARPWALHFSELEHPETVNLIVNGCLFYEYFQNKSLVETVYDGYGWSQPLCLIGNMTGNEMTVDENTVQKIGLIHDPIVVVSIVGPYRTGKSYLMNRLANKQTGW